jgi:hypothetical protein
MEAGILLMSRKERDRLRVLEMAKRGRIKLRKAAELLLISYRQCKRIYKRYREEGDEGLVHRSRGRASNRCKDPVFKAAVIARYRSRYNGFGPTLATEKLAKDGYKIHHETLRLWLLDKGLWARQRKRKKYRSWRERKEHRGEMVQMDGSIHDWFEGRGESAVLINMVDDATGTTFARFHQGETTYAAMKTLWEYIELYGIPRSLYVDKDAVFITNREPTIQEELAGERPRTQFGRAAQRLGIRIIPAHSPQAKGRVERKNGVYQDRLVKELRLEGVGTIEGGNQILSGSFLDELNRRFAVEPKSSTDLHKPLPEGLELKRIFCFEEERVVDNDWTVRWKNRMFQIKRGSKTLPPARRKVIIQEWLDSSIHIIYRGKEVQCEEIRKQPYRQKKRIKTGVNSCGEGNYYRPSPDHPWKRGLWPQRMVVSP